MGRLYMLAWLRHVPLMGFLDVRAVFSHQCRREPWPGLVSATFNGIQLGALNLMGVLGRSYALVAHVVLMLRGILC